MSSQLSLGSPSSSLRGEVAELDAQVAEFVAQRRGAPSLSRHRRLLMTGMLQHLV